MARTRPLKLVLVSVNALVRAFGSPSSALSGTLSHKGRRRRSREFAVSASPLVGEELAPARAGVAEGRMRGMPATRPSSVLLQHRPCILVQPVATPGLPLGHELVPLVHRGFARNELVDPGAVDVLG